MYIRAAGQVHAREAGAPWRAAADKQLAADNAKAAREVEQRRITALAKQTCQGLKSMFGIAMDYSSFATRLTTAYKLRSDAGGTLVSVFPCSSCRAVTGRVTGDAVAARRFATYPVRALVHVHVAVSGCAAKQTGCCPRCH